MARGRHPLLPVRPIEVGRWWNADSSEEVDVVALDGAGGLLVGECKGGPIGSRDLDTLRRRGRLVAAELAPRTGSIHRTTHVLFSAGGLAEESGIETQIEDANDVLHLPIEALYEETAP